MQTEQVDMVVAATTLSGLSPQFWYEQILLYVPPHLLAPEEMIFQTANSVIYTSGMFRQTYLFPVLALLRIAGEPTLQIYNETDDVLSLSHAYCSMHSYQRGARTHVAKKRPGCERAATLIEVSEHGRWRSTRQHLDMPTLYFCLLSTRSATNYTEMHVIRGRLLMEGGGAPLTPVWS